MEIERRRVRVRGLDVHYLAAGEGPPLVLLHGDGDSAVTWRWVLPDLARDYRVYAPDLPGFGDSDKPAVEYSPAFFTAVISDLLDALGIGRAAVVGSSLGGLVALRLALGRPERVGALVLAGSAGLGRAINPTTVALTLPGAGELAIAWGRTPLGAIQRAWGRALVQLARPHAARPGWIREQVRLARTPGFLEATLSSLRAGTDIGGQREVLLDRLPELEMPTLVVWGTEDRVVPHTHGLLAVERLRHGELVAIPGCGHLPQVEQPARFVAALRPFLARHAPRREPAVA